MFRAAQRMGLAAVAALALIAVSRNARAEAEARDLVVDSAGNAYLAAIGYGPQDYLVVKLGPTGKVVWRCRYDGGTYYDYTSSIALSPDQKFVYVTGYSAGRDTSRPTVVNNYSDYLTLKIDTATGKLSATWPAQGYEVAGVRRWNGSASLTDSALLVRADATGVYVTGNSISGLADGTTRQEVVTLKYSEAGQLLWTSPLPGRLGPATLDGSGLTLFVGGTESTNLYKLDLATGWPIRTLIGAFGGGVILVDGDTVYTTATVPDGGASTTDAVVLRYDPCSDSYGNATFSETWRCTWGDIGAQAPTNDSAGKLVMANGALYAVGGKGWYAPDGRDLGKAVVTKIDPTTGGITGQTTFTVPNATASYGVAACSAVGGVLHMTGAYTLQSTNWYTPDTGTVKMNLDLTPSTTWANTGSGVGVRCFAPGGDAPPNRLVADTAGNVWVCGYARIGNTTCAFVLKYNATGKQVFYANIK